jgi:hypothetical protein
LLNFTEKLEVSLALQVHVSSTVSSQTVHDLNTEVFGGQGETCSGIGQKDGNGEAGKNLDVFKQVRCFKQSLRLDFFHARHANQACSRQA